MSDGKDWLEVADSIHKKVDLTGLAMGASYTGWALEYKSMFGLERNLHFNPNAVLSYLGKGADYLDLPNLGTIFKGVGFFNDLSVHVSDSSSVGVGCTLDVHRSALHYSSNREKKQCFYIFLVLANAIDLVMVIQGYKLMNEEKEKTGNNENTNNETKYDTSSIKKLFYTLLATSNVVLNILQFIEFKANEITCTLTNLEANLSAITSRLKTLASYDVNILDQLHPMIGGYRLRAADLMLRDSQIHAGKAIKTAEKVAHLLAAGENAH